MADLTRGFAPLRRLLSRFGWGHSGYRMNERSAFWALLALLALPFINDMVIVARVGFDAAYLDFRIFYKAAEAFREHPGGPIYSIRPNYLYPPFFLTVLVPLLEFSPRGCLAMFQVSKWIALVVALRCAWRIAAPRGESLPPIIMLASVVLVWRYFVNEMLNGNINMLILAAVLGGAALALRGRHIAAGFLVAVAASIKVTPALVLVYFLYKGWWRALNGAAAGFAVCLVLWPAVFIGWSDNLRLLGEWYQHIISGYLSQGTVYSIGTNQGLTPVLNRLFSKAIAFEPDGVITLIDLPAPVLNMLRLTLYAAILAALFWTCRGQFTPETPAIAQGAEIGLVQVAMLMLSGYTWKAHYVAMLLPYTVLLAYLADARYPATRRTPVIALLILSLLFMTLSAEIFGPAFADTLLAYGVVLYSGIFAATGLVLVRSNLRIHDDVSSDGRTDIISAERADVLTVSRKSPGKYDHPRGRASVF